MSLSAAINCPVCDHLHMRGVIGANTQLEIKCRYCKSLVYYTATGKGVRSHGDPAQQIFVPPGPKFAF